MKGKEIDEEEQLVAFTRRIKQTVDSTNNLQQTIAKIKQEGTKNGVQSVQ